MQFLVLLVVAFIAIATAFQSAGMKNIFNYII